MNSWLLCPPDFYTVSYEINPWMNAGKKPRGDEARKQWASLSSAISKIGIDAKFIRPADGLPDMVFTANAGLILNEKCALSTFRHPERQGEEKHFEAWFKESGFSTYFPVTGSFEGEGDALFGNDLLVMGYGFRTDISTHYEVANFLGYLTEKVLSVELVNPYFYHLDTCFCPLHDNLALITPEGFSEDSLRDLETRFQLIKVSKEDSQRFACNSVVNNKNIIIPAGCNNTASQLEAIGYTVFQVEMSEFILAGGAAKCLSLNLNHSL